MDDFWIETIYFFVRESGELKWNSTHHVSCLNFIAELDSRSLKVFWSNVCSIRSKQRWKSSFYGPVPIFMRGRWQILVILCITYCKLEAHHFKTEIWILKPWFSLLPALLRTDLQIHNFPHPKTFLQHFRTGQNYPRNLFT